MLERNTPHLAMIGIHKNGTWAAQKIIECVQTPEKVGLIVQNLRAYAPPLLLDQFGNYVVHKLSRASSYLAAPNFQGRAASPKTEANNNSQIQTPTRLLWIGNLDSAVTSEQLLHVFAPYGAIKNSRLLPEKECGFVNFVDQADASSDSSGMPYNRTCGY
ncbi:uncharacterized protein EDB91DRAFT_1241890 [Suillus paluster]|uniref:uncharacterized protein n=1 Tax=Suillus paluster TaxID=48578 RepID=UPI001B85BE5B|nr:uncharacterized protein EDB91DRAFT_1241890 [Suillus paluster]KAG1756848.1 hypothetical protein EDB91DRAFT_1241890 [Suillus paluster]